MIKSCFDSYKKHPIAFTIGPILKILEAIFDLLIPLFMKAIIDLTAYGSPDLIPNPLSQALGYLIRSLGEWVPDNRALSDALIGGTIILVMGIVGFGVTMITQYIAARTAMSVGTDIRDSLFKKIMSFSKATKNKIGNNKLLTIINSDSYLVQTGVLIFIRLIVRAPFIILGSLVISFILNVNIGFIFLVIIPLILLIIFLVMRKSSKEYLNIQQKLDDISVKTTDTIEGSKIIRGFDKVKDEQYHFEKKASSYKKQAIFVNTINALINPLTFAVISIATILVVTFGGLSLDTASDAKEAVLFASMIITEVAYLTQIFTTLMQLSNVILTLTKAGASRKRINEVLSIEETIVNDGEGIVKEINGGEELLSFKNVSLSYVSGGNLALDNISFSLNKGTSLGIIGGTGSGKSSIISLIERNIDPVDGTVSYKGEDIKSYRLNSLREDIGLVAQKSLLFKGTIKSNMLFAKEDASDEEIINALKLAKAYDFVKEYEDNINHEVKEKGSNFSGGQRQRLCIARALLKNPELLILDDSTSALDLLTDREVRENISKNFKGISKIIVSQRVSTIKDTDQIIVLSFGKVEAIGTHDELLRKSPVYKSIYESQLNNGGAK